MKKYSYIVNKQFRVNRSKNILTIVGVITSILLFVSVSYLSKYTQERYIEKARKVTGNYESIFEELNTDQVEKVKNNVKVEKVGLYKKEKNISIDIGDIEKNLEIYSLDNVSIKELFNPLVNLTEGYIPQSTSEIVLTLAAKFELNKNIGDTFSVDEKDYIIVGFYEDAEDIISNTLTAFTILDNYKINENTNIALTFKNNKNIIEDINEIAEIIGVKKDDDGKFGNIKYNNLLIEAYGIQAELDMNYVNKEKVSFIFINCIILILSIIFIYESIRVSLQDRIQEISVFRCIGATKNKIRYLLIKEEIIIGGISLIVGVILAHILIWFIIDIIFTKVIGINNYGVEFKIYYDVIISVTIFTIINMSIAMFLPMMMISNISPAQGSKSKYLTFNDIRVRKSKIIKTIFGYKGELAFKNIAVNKKNFLVISVSMILILLVFNSFSVYYLLNLKHYDYEMKNAYDIDATFYRSYDEDELFDSEEKVINRIDKIKLELEQLNVVDNMFFNIRIPTQIIVEGVTSNSQITKHYQIKSTMRQLEENKIEFNQGTVLIYDDNSINKIIPYITSSEGSKVKIDLDDFNKNGFVVANVGFANSKAPFKINEQSIYLYLQDANNEAIESSCLGFIDYKDMISGNRYGYYSRFTIIVSEEFYINNKYKIDKLETITRDIDGAINIKENIDYNKSILEIKKVITKNGGIYYESKETVNESKDNINVVAVLIYTIIFLMIIIGAINIINTRYINSILRRKEFGTFLAIGVKKDDLRKIIMLEGLVQWFIAAIIGTILSIITAEIIIRSYRYSIGAIYKVSIWPIVVGNSILLIISLLSSFLPYRKLKKIDVNDLLREEE